MKSLPIGKQHLETFIEDDLVYVDKTKLIYNLVEKTGYYFLSRPRRFGKSLLLDTLKQLFLGNKHLFENFWIYDKIDWTVYSVIHLDFSGLDYKESGLSQTIREELQRIAKSYQIQLEKSTIKGILRELIEQLSEKAKVVILVDEYDKPITDFITDLPQANINREVLRDFYSGLKFLSNKIQFVFITGIAKFAKVSLFSVLNHLDDITMNSTYATLTGITQDEMQHYFDDRIKNIAQQYNVSEEELLARIKNMYNGYSWDGKNFVYNPFSLLKFFNTGMMESYWFATGTPDFLIKMLRKNQMTETSLKKTRVGGHFFDSLDIRYGIDPYPLLFQTGYTTVKRVELERYKHHYTLDYPNAEVKYAFLQNLIESVTFKTPTIVNQALVALENALFARDIEGIETQLNVLFSDISYFFHPFEKKEPNQDRIEQEFKAWEGWFHTVIHLVLQFLGVHTQCEVSKHDGRIDAVVEVTDYLYIMEFKLEDAEKGLQQIKDRKYAQSYYNSKKEVLLMSIAFDQKKREVKAIEWEVWER